MKITRLRGVNLGRSINKETPVNVELYITVGYTYISGNEKSKVMSIEFQKEGSQSIIDMPNDSYLVTLENSKIIVFPANSFIAEWE
ncbi:hypothetical protein [Leuconostoc pseudomesenteroides]|uniref:hypothetical protein n=1 Tax=Leuconostoc pseudomesenteroides TaxID=33968 RepID=UPI0032DFC9CD